MASVLLWLLVLSHISFLWFHRILMIRVEAILVFVWIWVFELCDRHCVGGVVIIVVFLVNSSE